MFDIGPLVVKDVARDVYQQTCYIDLRIHRLAWHTAWDAMVDNVAKDVNLVRDLIGLIIKWGTKNGKDLQDMYESREVPILRQVPPFM